MAFALEAARVPIRSDLTDAFRREWQRLGEPGTWWSGADRVAIAATARAAKASEPRPESRLPEAAAEAAELMAERPASATRDWVAKVATVIGFPRYVELVGVVSRLAAVDSFHRALGLELEPLPRSVPGEPSQREETRASPGFAWVPTIGGGSIVHALSLVPEEAAAQEDLHGPLYLTYQGMAELDFQRGLNRPQMELVAARTSAVNLCFY